jgi:hypothetical protein
VTTIEPIAEQFMPSTLAGVPRTIRAAIAQVADYCYPHEERDYLDNCGNGPDGNARAGHVFEGLTLLRRWLEGHVDGLHVDTEVRIADPDRPGYLQLTRRKTVDEVAGEILALVGRGAGGGFTVVDGADEYFGVYPGADGSREWPEGGIVVYAVTGGSEGHYVHVEVRAGDGRSELLILGKGFAGADAAWTLARQLAGILGA